MPGSLDRLREDAARAEGRNVQRARVEDGYEPSRREASPEAAAAFEQMRAELEAAAAQRARAEAGYDPSMREASPEAAAAFEQMRAELAAEAMRESDGPSSMEGFYDQYSPEALRAANSIGEALEVGNIDLGRRPHAMNDDGSVSTVRSMSFAEEEDGPEILIPTVSDDGYIMSDQEAIDTYRLTGRHMGIYPDVPTANAAAEEIHLDQEANMPENMLEPGPDPYSPAASNWKEKPAPARARRKNGRKGGE
jgi:hypothetical protein